MASISKETARNWQRLRSASEGKLTKRANKTQSRKRIIASTYLDDPKAHALLNQVLSIDASVENLMYTLVYSALSQKGLLDKPHVQDFLRQYSGLELVPITLPEDTWESDEDVLGFIYQSLITEGERNSTGQYYTSRRVVDYMVGGKKLSATETFLDPCCGSGAFLTAVQTPNPAHLYGFDISPIAVMIASVNLMIKHKDIVFQPQIYCLDFLRKDLYPATVCKAIPQRFDHIYTNPPWGRDKEGLYTPHYPAIRSKERASMFIAEALERLDSHGTLYFLLPTSLLKIKKHQDIRGLILSDSTIEQIDLYKGRFDGVFTDYFSLRITPRETDTQRYVVTGASGKVVLALSEEERIAGNIAIEAGNSLNNSIQAKMEALAHDTLTHSLWALGIVTGDNQHKVKKEKTEGLEPVYTGKQVSAFRLEAPTSYLLFEPKSFQQCAKETFYRASEKLIYRFIARYPIVAYDDQQRLCLNSANILIPRLDTISVKSAAALLNSTLYRYYYSVKFPDIKVLKSNLQALPFPNLSQQQDKALSTLVAEILSSSHPENYQKKLDNKVYSIFGITAKEQAHIATRMERTSPLYKSK